MAHQQSNSKARLVIQLVVCCLLGYVTCMGVAWVAVLRVVGPGQVAAIGPTERQWRFQRSRSWPPPTREIRMDYGWAVRGFGLSNLGYSENTVTAGWPFLSFRYSKFSIRGIMRGRSMDGLAGGVAIPGKRTAALGGRLPVVPVWPGAAMASALFSILIWLLAFCPGIARRALRRRQGRCQTCGYKITGVDYVCSECGATISVPEGGR